jgi:hypothetical protein
MGQGISRVNGGLTQSEAVRGGLLAGVILAWALGGCGGIVEHEAPAGGGGSPGSGSGSGADPGSGSGARSGSGGAGNGQTPLGACSPGFSYAENPDLPCNWLADGRCYEEKLDACACICPRRAGTTCISGFYGGEGSATEVSCD